MKTGRTDDIQKSVHTEKLGKRSRISLVSNHNEWRRNSPITLILHDFIPPNFPLSFPLFRLHPLWLSGLLHHILYSALVLFHCSELNFMFEYCPVSSLRLYADKTRSAQTISHERNILLETVRKSAHKIYKLCFQIKLCKLICRFPLLL